MGFSVQLQHLPQNSEFFQSSANYYGSAQFWREKILMNNLILNSSDVESSGSQILVE